MFGSLWGIFHSILSYSLGAFFFFKCAHIQKWHHNKINFLQVNLWKTKAKKNKTLYKTGYNKVKCIIWHLVLVYRVQHNHSQRYKCDANLYNMLYTVDDSIRADFNSYLNFDCIGIVSVAGDAPIKMPNCEIWFIWMFPSIY